MRSTGEKLEFMKFFVTLFLGLLSCPLELLSSKLFNEMQLWNLDQSSDKVRDKFRLFSQDRRFLWKLFFWSDGQCSICLSCLNESFNFVLIIGDGLFSSSSSDHPSSSGSSFLGVVCMFKNGRFRSITMFRFSRRLEFLSWFEPDVVSLSSSSDPDRRVGSNPLSRRGVKVLTERRWRFPFSYLPVKPGILVRIVDRYNAYPIHIAIC